MFLKKNLLHFFLAEDAGFEYNLFIKENVDVFPSDPPGRDANARL